MHDIKWIRESPEAFDEGLTRRGLEPSAARILALDEERRDALTFAQEIQTRRNKLAKEIGRAKSRGEDATELIESASIDKDAQEVSEKKAGETQERLEQELSGLPNTPGPDVPVGSDDSANLTLREVGEKPGFAFEPKEHFDLGEALGLLDFETAAKLSGARFVVMRGALARLHRALANFMIEVHTEEHGYTEVAPPYLVRDHVLFGTGQLPKFGQDQFRTTDDFWLIPTAEVPLTNLVAGEILDEAALPIRVAALTPCFRSEAGAGGKDTRGMLRQHQFDKVEMVSIVRPDRSEAELERMTTCAEEVLKRLGLHYRVVVLSTGDMGFAARKTHDIEVWLPGQGKYREISSCSNCWDFQARRMQARFRPAGEKGTRFVHTLNGSGVAVGRALIAVMETYQRADGSIGVPQALHPYMRGPNEIRSHA
ncbi:MAG: serine--tRNA ligase [Kiloniellales bacterium]